MLIALAAAVVLALSQTLSHAQCTAGRLPGWPVPMLQRAGQGPGPLQPRLLATGRCP